MYCSLLTTVFLLVSIDTITLQIGLWQELLLFTIANGVRMCCTPCLGNKPGLFWKFAQLGHQCGFVTHAICNKLKDLITNTWVSKIIVVGARQLAMVMTKIHGCRILQTVCVTSQNCGKLLFGL